MAKKRKVNKSQAVRDYMASHPTATSGEISAALKKSGIEVAPGYVANIKTKSKHGPAPKKAAKKTAKPVVAVELAPVAAVEKPAKAGDAITIDQIKKVVLLTQRLGGYSRVCELLDTVRELGGIKRFKELASAIAGTESDGIPF